MDVQKTFGNLLDILDFSADFLHLLVTAQIGAHKDAISGISDCFLSMVCFVCVFIV